MKTFELILIFVIGIAFSIRNYSYFKYKKLNDGQNSKVKDYVKEFHPTNKFSLNFLSLFVIIPITEKAKNKESKKQKAIVNIATLAIYFVIVIFIALMISGYSKIILPKF
ncbi:MAG TPA: hypothetical protein PKN48_14255 [Bacteroidales bacterium]|nr:hypothetical protein [Bacteroidales bacterium]